MNADREVGMPTIIAVVAAIILIIILLTLNAESGNGAREPFIKVTRSDAEHLPMNVRVMKVDSARGVVCYGAVDLVLGTTLSCVKVEP